MSEQWYFAGTRFASARSLYWWNLTVWSFWLHIFTLYICALVYITLFIVVSVFIEWSFYFNHLMFSVSHWKHFQSPQKWFVSSVCYYNGAILWTPAGPTQLRRNYRKCFFMNESSFSSRLCFAAQVCFHFSFKDVLRSDSRRYFECVFHNIVTFRYFRFKLKYISHIYMAAFITAMRRPYRATQGKDYCNITADSVTPRNV